MKKRIFISAIILSIVYGFLPVAQGLAAVPRLNSGDLISDGSDICRLLGEAEGICQEFLRFIESNRVTGQTGNSISMFEWLDENLGGQLQVVDLQQSSASLQSANMQPLQVHVFVVKDDQSIASQSTGRAYELFVIVLDQKNNPVPGAKVDYVVEYVDHRETHSMPQLTNTDGIVSTQFHVDLLPNYQMVKVGVLVNSKEQQKNAGAAFWGGY